jgi:hypothetical protein
MEPGVAIECPRCEKVFVAPDYEGRAPETVREERESPMPPRRAERQPEIASRLSGSLTCPSCAARLERTAAMEPGVSVQCPRCEKVFVAPDEEGQAPVTFTDRRGEAPAPRRALPIDEESRPRRRRENFTHHWKADLGEWFAIANRSWTRIMGPTAGYMFLVGMLLLIVVVAVVFGVLVAVGGPGRPPRDETLLLLQAVQNFVGMPIVRLVGIYLLSGVLGVALRELRGREWNFGSFFMGFNHLGALSMWWFIQELLGFILGGPILVVALLLPLMGPGGARPEEMLGVLGLAYLWYIVFGIIYAYCYLRWALALCLILDRDMTAIQAMKTSWGMTKNHVLIIFATFFIMCMIFFVGYIACCVGLLFAFSYITLLNAAMYLEALYPRDSSAIYED